MSAPHRPPDSHYNINVTLSDMTSLDRELPDTRPPICAKLKYDIKSLPKVSIVIPFFNEAPTMLLRNIHSILNRSPDELLEEIILVDDLSYDAPLMEPLERFIKNIPRISLLRNDQRSGLIVSRMRGARIAKAPAIIFLDAHSEVNEGWLEPLLDQLRKNPKQVLQPFIDGVDNMNLQFSAPSVYFKGTFSWDLRYTWTKIADHEQERAVETGEPFITPTLVGCALAVMKDYFFDIGSFDEGMYVWGGENIELAFRAWMCGGKAVTVTCSRVGHVFKQSPNKFDGTKGSKEETVQKNLIRVADVWMDGMRKFFYGTTLMFDFKRLKLGPADLKTLRERTELRKKLKCHNFEWYLYNVVPEMLDLPPMEKDYYVGMTYFCFEHKIIPKNNFAIMKNGLMTYRDKCVKINQPKPYLTLAECPPESEIDKFGKWDLVNYGMNWGGIKVSIVKDDGVVVYWCIVQVTNAMPQHRSEQMPQLGTCDSSDSFQIWSFTYAVDFTLVPEYMSVYEQKL
ncbi:hypothetical protein HELRODRAFT_156550 [Helobdella robusta]|uniref:Glycosyltransferase 2-like domain-containing protein n=1 Tax=Helobdella robusta TaxID=6412 RepID=T1ELY1_HELRO|nr:hypothetical protein HELRODRAFT_156550 [Helobdella robusta]ESO08964.1 hypothetical protein HELRODRAFT_156550 [Helobdella robusta]